MAHPAAVDHLVAAPHRSYRTDCNARPAAKYLVGPPAAICMDLLLFSARAGLGLHRRWLHEAFVGGRPLPIFRDRSSDGAGGSSLDSLVSAREGPDANSAIGYGHHCDW